MERLLNVTTILSVLLMALVLFSVRRSHIRVEYSVSWLAAAVILLVLSRSSFALNLDLPSTGSRGPPAGPPAPGFLRVRDRDLPSFGGYFRPEGRQHRDGPADRDCRVSIAKQK